MVTTMPRRLLSIRTFVTVMLIVGVGGDSLGFNLDGTPWLWAVALGIGLFSSTFGIDLQTMRTSDWRVVALAVTVGVFIKAAIIGGTLWLTSMWLGSASLVFLVLGLEMAQMDPVAMAALAGKRRMSERADNLARAVSSLDDPVTVLLTILLVVGQRVFGFDLGVTITNIGVDNAPSYGVYLWLNIAFMTSMVWIWQLAYRGGRTWKLVFTLGLIACAIIIGASWYWMFGLALMGIYLRPEETLYNHVGKALDWAARGAFAVTGVVAGSLLFGASGGEKFVSQLLWGLGLGFMAFVSQMIVGYIMTIGGGYTSQDRWYFACSHQNGLTATMLGVSTETMPFVIPGIVMTHVLHGTAMVLLNRRYKPVVSANAQPQLA